MQLVVHQVVHLAQVVVQVSLTWWVRVVHLHLVLVVQPANPAPISLALTRPTCNFACGEKKLMPKLRK